MLIGNAIERPAAGKMHFKHLPHFAAYLLDHWLDLLCRESLSLAREMDYPLLRYFAQIPEEQLLAISRSSQIEFLTHVMNNTLDEHIAHSLQQWRENQLPLIDKDQVVGEDITMGSYMRKKVWLKFMSGYTADTTLSFDIMSELDEFHMYNDAASFRTFINIQREKLDVINAALQRNETLYKQAQALTHIGNWGWQVGQDTMEWSDEMYRIYGLEPQSEQITFDRFISLIHPDDREQRIEQIHRSLVTLDPPHYIMRILRPDGTIIVISGKNEVITDSAGTAIQMVGTCQDITTSHHLQESMREMNQSLESKNKELERSNKELTSFSYVASHDLQEPLRKIKTYSDMIMKMDGGRLSEKGLKYFDNINASAHRMHQLIQDLLSYSRTHHYIKEVKPVDIHMAVREVCAHYDDLIAEGSLTLDIGELPVINGISFQYYQLFENIIGNSIKYRKSDTPLIVRIYAEVIDGHDIDPAIGADRSRRYHHITVMDNGIGFAPEFNTKIFEIFQRLHHADEYSGTGIGLAICTRIVQNHDGYISASGVPGMGATFSVYLPV